MSSIFIFRRDYRLYDNIGLINCLKNNKNIIPIFIFTPEQITNKNNYKSSNAIQFMIESLKELNQKIKLNLFFGNDIKVINEIINNNNIKSIYTNTDYSPFAIKRDIKINNFCKKNNILFKKYDDILLYDLNKIKTKIGSYYKKFTPYYKNVIKINVNSPINYNLKNNKIINIKNKYSINFDYSKKFYKNNLNINVIGGRKNGLKILKNIKYFKDYNNKRNILNINTTHLSSYIKFGCISIREVYHTIKNNLGIKNQLIKQLIWRDFYFQLGYHNKNTFKGAMKDKYNKLKWSNSKSLFNKWKNGNTGYPIVDACMNQLNTTGYIHNRGRLIVASFLIKNLQIDWRWGEKYFAQKLVDYSPLINNGNYQWVASTGSDSQPYFRIFNPWLQSEKFDKECNYIKKWIPILKDVENKHIHKWFKYNNNYKLKYPKPIVDYKKSKEKTLKMYNQIF